MANVNAIISTNAGVTSDDIPDYCYREMYEDGCDPEDAADEAIADFLDNL